MLKSQILAGGRGLGKFKNGLQGGVHIVNVDKVQELGEQMLNQVLVTKQTGPAGKPVNTLYLAAKMQLTNEMYFAILLDRSSAGPMMIGCSEGGTSIEDLAEKYPEKIIKIPVDIREGITDAQANEMVDGLQVTTDKKAAAEQIKNLYNMFTACDCTMVEVSPLACTIVFHVCYIHSCQILHNSLIHGSQLSRHVCHSQSLLMLEAYLHGNHSQAFLMHNSSQTYSHQLLHVSPRQASVGLTNLRLSESSRTRLDQLEQSPLASKTHLLHRTHT